MANTNMLPSGDRINLVFDASSEYTIRITYTGNQVVGNRLIIRDNRTNAEVYDHEIESMRLEHTIPPGTLMNGTVYNARVQVRYRKGGGGTEIDIPSEAMLINCLDTPTVSFLNLSSDDTVTNSSYSVSIVYSQAQNDLANRYWIRLYDSGKHEIWSSGLKYVTPSDSTYVFSEVISNLQHAQSYYLSCEMECVGGLAGSSGLVGFFVSYQKPRSYSTMYVESIPEEYAVLVSSNIKVIDGIISGSPFYIDDEYIDLTDEQSTVSWTSMGTIDSDFQIMLSIRHGQEAGKEVLILRGQRNHICVLIQKGLLWGQTGEQFYAILYSFLGNERYITISNLIAEPAANTLYCLSVVRRSAFYSVSLIPEVRR